MLVFFDLHEIPEWVAREVAQVGIMPARDRYPIGATVRMGGQCFMVTGYTDRDEFIRVATEALPDLADDWLEVPTDRHFTRVSTD